MSALGGDTITLLDHARTLDPDGKPAKIAELLSDTNEIVQHLPYVETNDIDSHIHTIRSGLPTGTFRAFNEAVAPEKGTNIQVRDGCGMLEGWNSIDKDLAERGGNTEEFRLSQDRAHIIGLGKTMASVFWYGNSLTDPKKPMGLAPRYNLSTAENGGNIIKCGGSGSVNTSIWLLVLSPDTIFGLYPKGTKAGIDHMNLGLTTTTDSNGKKKLTYDSRFHWKSGVAVKDWRYGCRACNIDVNNLTSNAATGANLIDVMAQMLEKVEDLVLGKPVFFCNRTVRSFLRRQISNKVNVNLTLDTAGGKHVLMYDTVPVALSDAILNTEATVS